MNESREGRTELGRREDGGFPWLGVQKAIGERHIYRSQACSLESDSAPSTCRRNLS